jgi:ABC-type lipoprotein release transport system permease subunit
LRTSPFGSKTRNLQTLDNLTDAPSNPVSSRIEQQAPQLKFIDDWEQVVETIRRLPNVRAVVPVVSGQGFASKGANPMGVAVVGAEPGAAGRDHAGHR